MARGRPQRRIPILDGICSFRWHLLLSVQAIKEGQQEMAALRVAIRVGAKKLNLFTKFKST